ncbi:hypothetical protein N7481_013144 [Penicillium waksmanii]|uniref:uncharacterized protein n=1 Tax=Penicillium waksmanii TaxID=69791 RepID=UPI00254750D2|nr:uncharacterized protein N7481_013144 [Penicillium waksmanii]KAJ5966430.1 hypothetical protein N7481_013144 [Penicillium waksmanii]
MLHLFRDCIEFFDPDAVGWKMLSAFENVGLSDYTRNGYLQLCQQTFSFLRERLQEEITVSVDQQAIEYALNTAAVRGDVVSMDLIFEFDPQKVIYSDSLERGRPVLEEFPHWLALQFLAEKGIDIRTSLHGETPTSRCLEFSDQFFHWRHDARILFPNIDRLIERETSELAPRLRGWCFDLLLDLFSLDLHEPLKDQKYLQELIYFADGDMMKCLECRNNREIDFFHGNYDGLMIEPWWVELKNSIKNRECLCLIDDVVQDGRDGNNIIHKSCRIEDIDSDSGSQASHSFGKWEYSSDTQPKQTQPKQTQPKQTQPKQTQPKQTQPKQTQDTGSQVNSDTNDDPLQDSASDMDVSNNLIRGASPPDQRCFIHRWGDVIPFQYWAEHCYKKYGGWMHEYERCEYYCFYCLALRECWDEEYEEVCDYFQAPSKEGERGGSDLDEPDSDESASD